MHMYPYLSKAFHKVVKYVILSYCLLAICSFVVRAQTAKHIIYPGVGFDNIQIDKSTLKDVIKYYGNNYTVDTHYFKPWTKTSYSDTTNGPPVRDYNVEIAYKHLGLSFYFEGESETVFSICFSALAKAITDKGIIVNKSTFQEVVDAYGDEDWSFSSGRVRKNYASGIVFSSFYKGILPTTLEKLRPYLCKKVSEISIGRSRRSNTK